MGERVGEHEIAFARKRRNDAKISEITGTEDERPVRVLEPRKPRLEPGIKRMVARNQARGARAEPIAAKRARRRVDHRRVRR